MANTLEDLAILAALVGGTHYRNKQVSRANRIGLQQQEAENKYRQDLLNYRRTQDEGEAKRAADATALKDRQAKVAQLRMAFMPLLNMGRTPTEQAELSRNPERYQALQMDQA